MHISYCDACGIRTCVGRNDEDRMGRNGEVFCPACLTRGLVPRTALFAPRPDTVADSSTEDETLDCFVLRVPETSPHVFNPYRSRTLRKTQGEERRKAVG